MFGLTNIDNEQYKILYRVPNYELILEELTDGSAPWTRNENQEVMSFPKVGLKEVAKVWFYFVPAKLVPSKHLSTVGRDKALLTYAIVKGYKFNMGKIIENSILDSTYQKAITHPSLIKKLCELEEVPIRENEEKCSPICSHYISH